ncbi:Fe(3+)-transporting ATPase [Bacteroides coprosuis DSM 18011]|uniref:Fe(3+)-transporting ATPase n=1 Tax=Bacteroides coprosuis DSM 18011 TaxID=679937 RepID=F3ZUP8_9BACE|nr:MULTISPECIES: ATP-binding cassette domain-containing protein [Bacteroides]EGJ71213.1 Fe(3+)-transporting ATPase [Bacteroides coprosuis DSM 18011]
MEKPLVDYKNVEIRQGNRVILQNVNLSLNSGDLVYLVGEVGSGKSTFLQTLYQEIPIQSGIAEILGYRLNQLREKDLPKLRQKLGIVFQDFKLLPDRTIHANLSFVLEVTGWQKWAAINQRIDEVLEIVDMKGSEDKYPYELSGGEQQRIAIARAILNRPAILLVDEPTGNLDFITGKSIFTLLQHMAKEGTLVIMATHNLYLVREFPGKVFQIKSQTLQNITEKIYVREIKD